MAGSTNYRIEVTPVLKSGEIQKQLNAAGLKAGKGAGKTAGGGFASQFATELKHKIDYAVINLASTAMRDMVSNVLELDKAQTELKKVTTLSGDELKNFTNQAYEVGKATAKTGTEIIQASTEFAKMGKSPETALQLSELATRFQNIADTEIDAATAAKFINSQIKAFGDTTSLKKFTGDFEKAEHIIDATNEVANNFAVGTNDLQSALTKTGTALSVTGNTFEQTIGMVTAGTEIMVGQSSRVGRGLRTIAINISKLAKENKTFEAANGKVNLRLQESNGEMRSTYDILGDLSNVWGDLNETERTAIANTLAGKTQFEVFNNVLKNWGSAVAASEKATDSQNSSLEENRKYLESIEGHLQGFRTAWEQLSYHLVNSEGLKALIDTGTVAIKVLDKLIETIGTVPTVMGIAFGGVGIKKLLGGLNWASLFGLGTGAKVAEKAGAEIAEGIAEGMTSSSSKGVFAKGLSVLGSAGGAILGTALATGALFYITKKLKDQDVIDVPIEKYEKTKVAIQDIQKEIDSLEGKGDKLTQQEKNRLEYLKLQLEILKEQAKVEKDKIRKQAIREVKKAEGGLSKDSGEQLVGEKYVQSKQKQLKIEQEIAEIQARTDITEQDKIDRVDKLRKAQNKFKKDEAESLNTLNELYGKLGDIAETGEEYNELDKDTKKYFNDIASGYLSTIKDVRTYRKELKSLPKKSKITISAVDENGNLQQTTASAEKLQSLSDEELRMILDVEQTGDWKDIDKYIDEGKGSKSFIDIITKFHSEGYQDVDNKKKDISTDTDVKFNYKVGENPALAEKIILKKDEDSKINFKTGKNTAKETKDNLGKPISTSVNFGLGAVSAGLRSLLNKLDAKSATTGSGKSTKPELRKATGKRRGEAGGLAWLGDEGTVQNPRPELVVGEHGAYLAGTQGWEQYPLKSSDTVYTYAQTKKLLGGSQKIFSAGEIPRFAKGKNSKARKAFDNALATLEYKRDVYHWTDKYFQEQYKKLFNKYKKRLSLEQRRDYYRSRADYRHEKAVSDIESSIDVVAEAGTIKKTLQAIDNARKARKISNDEAKKMRAEAYHNNLIYARKEFEAGKVSYDDLLKIAKNYWKEVGTDSKEYYESLDELREASRRDLENQQEQHDDEMDYMKQYIQLQISSLEHQKKMNDREKQSVEDAEELVELQNNLAQARSTMVKVWREGVGWVYEQDTKAIKEAQKALDDFNEAHETDSIDEMIQRYQDVLDLFGTLGEEADLIKLGEKLGISGWQDLIKGSVLDIDYMSEWIKSEYAWINALDDLSQQLENMTAEDYAKYKETGITSEMIAEKIAQYAYDPNLLYARPELRGVIGIGGFTSNNPITDAYIPEAISRIAEIASDTFSQIVNIQHLELPNVENATDFAREIQGIKNRAIQLSNGR